MRTTTSLRLVYAAVVDCLEDAGLVVGQGSGDGLTPPYVVAYALPSGQADGSLADPYCVEPVVQQVSSWGETVEQALDLADTARSALFAGIDPPDGWTVMHVAEDVGAGVTRDDDTAGPPLFQAVNRYRFWLAPTATES